MKSLRLRSAIIASIAPMLICTMLLGSVLISNVYAKGSGSEKSQLIWMKIVRMIIKENRSL